MFGSIFEILRSRSILITAGCCDLTGAVVKPQTARQLRSSFNVFIIRGTHGNGGPTRIRKKFNGSLVVLAGQVNGIAGELVVKTGVQLTRFVEACT